MLSLPTIFSLLLGSKPQRHYRASLLVLLTGLPTRPTHRDLSRYDGRWVACFYDVAAFNPATLCEVVPYEHELAYAGDSTFLPKTGPQVPEVDNRWHSGECRVAWGQQLELLSVLDLEEGCSYHVHSRLQAGNRSQPDEENDAPKPLRANVKVMRAVLDETQAVNHMPDVGTFEGDGHDATKEMLEGFAERNLSLVSKLRQDACLWRPYGGPPRCCATSFSRCQAVSQAKPEDESCTTPVTGDWPWAHQFLRSWDRQRGLNRPP